MHESLCPAGPWLPRADRKARPKRASDASAVNTSSAITAPSARMSPCAGRAARSEHTDARRLDGAARGVHTEATAAAGESVTC